MNLTRAEREKIFQNVADLVDKKHFKPDLNNVDWHAVVEERRARVLDSEAPEQFEHEMHEMVTQLKTSHTGFFHQSARTIPARLSINATFDKCDVSGVERWMFLDIHEGGPAHSAGIEPGDVLLNVGEEEVGPPTRPVFKMGQATRITVLKRHGKEASLDLNVPSPKMKKHPVNHPQAVVFRKLGDGIGLLRVTMFPGIVGIDFARDIDRAVRALECDRLIVDMRGNTGGGIGGLRLMSYLTLERKPIGYSLSRARAEKGYKKESLPRFGKIPHSKLALLWLALRYAHVAGSVAVVTEGLGPQAFHGRVLMLVNHHSASAAEIVAGFAAENKLATIVGTKTAGRLMSGGAYKVGHGYVLGLPVGAFYTWQGKLLEGKGIQPDVEVKQTYESLKAGLDPQMEKAVEIASGL
jgi:carboxyl-terminal processing protease